MGCSYIYYLSRGNTTFFRPPNIFARLSFSPSLLALFFSQLPSLLILTLSISRSGIALSSWETVDTSFYHASLTVPNYRPFPGFPRNYHPADCSVNIALFIFFSARKRKTDITGGIAMDRDKKITFLVVFLFCEKGVYTLQRNVTQMIWFSSDEYLLDTLQR